MNGQIAQQPQLELLIALITPFLSGIFTLASTILQSKLKNVPVPSSINPLTTKVSPFVSLGKVLLHAGIVLLVVTITYFVIFAVTRYVGVPRNLISPLILSQFFLFRWISYILAFMWVAAKVDRVIRWKHLIYVAIITSIITMLLYFIYTPLSGGPPSLPGYVVFFICYTVVQVFASMGAGGAITNAMKPN